MRWRGRALQALASVLPEEKRDDFVFKARTVYRRARKLPPPVPPKKRPWIVSPAPKPIDLDWPEPPTIEHPGTVVQTLYDTGSVPPPMNADLFESLNEEYAKKRSTQAFPKYQSTRLAEQAQRRLVWVHEKIDLANKRVLEFGCGSGYETWYLAAQFGADAYGVDVQERRSWSVLQHDRCHLQCVDLTVDDAFPENFFDRVISFTVWEHIVHPYRALEAVYRALKPGGIAFIRANLYRGPSGSHLYRDIFFPWPHLLFPDEVVEEWYARRGLDPKRPVWVNKLTWPHYEDYFARIGFKVRSTAFTNAPIDEEFYQRFSHILNRYSRTDLERDFVTVILQKPR